MREHMEMYARIKGIKEADIPKVSMDAIQTLGLIKFTNKQAGQLSGGNKRKLSVAIALVAEPPIVFLGTCALTRSCCCGRHFPCLFGCACEAVNRDVAL